MTSGRDRAVELPALCDDGRRGDAREFDVFFQEQYRALVQFLRRRTSTRQDAEDAAQESMSRLLRYRESQPPSAWKPLLYRIATNVACDQARRAQTHHDDKHVSIDDQACTAAELTPEQQAARDQDMARLSQAILELPPKCRRVYLLKRVHELKHADVAVRCGISVKTVEKHLARALVLLRRKVGESSSGAF